MQAMGVLRCQRMGVIQGMRVYSGAQRRNWERGQGSSCPSLDGQFLQFPTQSKALSIHASILEDFLVEGYFLGLMAVLIIRL